MGGRSDEPADLTPEEAAEVSEIDSYLVEVLELSDEWFEKAKRHRDLLPSFHLS